MRRLCAETNVIGVDIVELAPERDQTYLSTMNVNRVVRECLTGIGLRKQGIDEADYLSPLTTDDGRD
jgi:arginase family enzyme